MADCTVETVGNVVVAGLSRAGWRVSVGHMLETLNADGSATVQVWTVADCERIRQEGYAQTGAIVAPSYVVTIVGRDGGQ